MMPTSGREGVDTRFARMLAGPWWSLTKQEQAEAIAYAKLAGPLVALAWFGEVAREPSRNSFSEALPSDADPFEDGLLIEGARVHGLPNPAFYLRFVVGTAWPEKLEEWRAQWDEAPEALLHDPRVYHFCAAFERERCRLLGEEEPPTDGDALALLSWERREEERELARELLDRVFAGEELEDPDLQEVLFEYELQRARVDQSTMLIAAATEGEANADLSAGSRIDSPR